MEHETKPASSPQELASPLCLLSILALSFGAWFLSKLSDPNQNSNSSRHPQPKTNDTATIGQNIPSPIHVIVDASPPTPTPNEKRESADEQKEGRDRKRLRWEIATTCLLAAYTVVTVLLWLATMRANHISSENSARVDKNFRADERAWLGLSLGAVQLQSDPVSKKPQALLIPFQIVNTGRTVAKNTSGEAVVTIINKGEKLSFNFADYSSYALQGGAMFPNGQMGLTQPPLKRGPDGKAHVIAPTADLLRRINAFQAFPTVFGEVNYCDIFGVRHKTKFCRYVTGPGLIDEDCMKYNDADNNEKPDKVLCPVTGP